MSLDGTTRRRRPWRIFGWSLLAVIVALALIVAFAAPWGPIRGLTVERATLVAAPPAAGQADPADTPQQIVVTFSTPDDLARLRAAKGAEFIKASLSACEKDDVNQTVAVTQSAGLFREGRVVALPPTGAGDARRYRYRATFDDWLPIPQGSTTRIVRAADVGGGLCFSLIGGSMWLGRLWSDRIALRLDRRATPAGR